LKEIWKDIRDYEGHYQVSSLGSIRNIKEYKPSVKKLKARRGESTIKNKAIKLAVGDNGYYKLTLSKNNIRKSKTVHRLVAKAFLQKSIGRNVVNHINAKKLDNRACNLEYVTTKENCEHAVRLGLYPRNTGEAGNYVKLTTSKVYCVVFLIKYTTLSYREIGLMFSVNRNTISSIKNNYTWKHLEFSFGDINSSTTQRDGGKEKALLKS
jgi:hypothetical protein